jgi:tryptophan synthase alpha subunit
MSRISKAFQELRSTNKKALITYITAGDPCLDMTEKLVYSIESAGADIIELGIPFTDPLADGPTIQRSTHRALMSGVKIADIFQMVHRVREKCIVPLVFLEYSAQHVTEILSFNYHINHAMFKQKLRPLESRRQLLFSLLNNSRTRKTNNGLWLCDIDMSE